jgi:hypothetical protein
MLIHFPIVQLYKYIKAEFYNLKIKSLKTPFLFTVIMLEVMTEELKEYIYKYVELKNVEFESPPFNNIF